MANPAPRPLLGLAAGIAAGLVASAAMAAVQSLASSGGGGEGEDDDPATVKAADKVTQAIAGVEVPEPWRDRSGQIVHYVTGAALGGLYGVLAEYRPRTSAGFGSAYGLVTAALLDEAAVPAAGLGAPPWKAPLGSHATSVVSHLVYGVVLEGARALLGRRGR